LGSIDWFYRGAKEGLFEIQFTSQFIREMNKSPEAVQALFFEWFSDRDDLDDAAGNIFRLDYSELDGIDTVGSVSDFLDSQLRGIVGVRGKEHRRYGDIDQLIGHRNSGADAFVTLDGRTINNHKPQLLELGICVVTPHEVRESYGS
jgi:hypothetical protein